MSDAVILQGNSLEVLKTFPDNSVDSIVTDPPYGLSFMGKKWDYDVPSAELWHEVLRVLKPGGYLLSFGGTRTYHRMVVQIEDAGFEIRDQIQWIYGSGFPKSMNVGKQVPAFEGFGTALKPANEPIVLARKPLSESTVVKNVLKWGTGALNIDGSRISVSADDPNMRPNAKTHNKTQGSKIADNQTNAAELCTSDPGYHNSQGRWPANMLFDEEAAAMLDDQSGVLKSGNIKPYKNNGGWKQTSETKTGTFAASSGGASRFFYVAKASKRERNAGLEGMPEKDPPGSKRSTPAEGRTSALGSPRANHHPTVKPIKLMEYLCKLITPPNGTILDPFCGSGSTGVAAVKLGFSFIGIDLSNEYCEIAEKRINNVKNVA